MIHISDIPKDTILNKAIQDATSILLKPHTSLILSELNSPPINYEGRYIQKWKLNLQDFLLRMSTVAWNFLNVFNASQEYRNQAIEEEYDLDNEI